MKFPKNYNLFEMDDKNSFGIKMVDNELKFMVPKMLYNNNLGVIDQFELLAKYQKILLDYAKTNNQKQQIDSFISLEKTWGIINGCLALLNDYFKNDDFVIIDKFYKKSNRRVNWKKTLTSGDVIISDNQVIYDSFISNSKINNKNNDFFILYKHTLNYAKSLFLSNYNYKYKNIPFSNNQKIYIINKFIDDNYRDRDVTIAKILKQIYENGGLDKNIDKLFETPFHEKFENIWEFLIEQIIPDELNKSDSLKQKNLTGKYTRISNNKEYNGVSYKIDHIMRKDQSILILDSKFYQSYYDDEKFPDTSSITKQEHYKTIVKDLFGVSDIKSYFIFPKHDKGSPEFFAVHRVDGSENFKIYCFAFDVNYIINIVAKGRKINDLWKILQTTNEY
jgi:hypothetical protein